MILVPGVSGSGTGTGGRIDGQTANTQHIYIDGQDIYSANGNGTNTGPPPQEMIQAFELQTTQYSAEYSTPQGGVYVFATKSGTNKLHGSLFEYWQNNLLDANKPYVNTNPYDRKNDFGFSLAVPSNFRRSSTAETRPSSISFPKPPRTFSSSGSTTTVPTVAYRTGDFSAALTGRKLTGTDPGRQPVLREHHLRSDDDSHVSRRGSAYERRSPTT